MSLFISNFIYCNSTSKRQNSIIYGPDGCNFVKVTLLWVCGSKIYSDTIIGCTMMRFHPAGRLLGKRCSTYGFSRGNKMS